jgi:murein DD-endopeptidase MepM/ murein hydrolase activator NlpD
LGAEGLFILFRLTHIETTDKLFYSKKILMGMLMLSKKHLTIFILLIGVVLIISHISFTDKQKATILSNLFTRNLESNSRSGVNDAYQIITGTIKKGETLFDIFKKHNLDIADLFELKQASAGIHRLRDVYPGRPYKTVIDDKSQIREFTYWIDDENILNIIRTGEGFSATRKTVEYEKKILYIGGTIQDNLIESIGDENQDFLLALQLSDIFAWDIDFTTDLRKGDVFKIVVDGCYLDNAFKKYGNILAAEFINNGETYHAFRFEYNGKVDYYDDEGKSLRRAFLKAPLSYSRISSGFSKRRYHPILKINRPHLGVDYAAPIGTPISAVGDGTVVFAGYKGQNGNLVMIKHPNSFRTYYGHLLKIKKGIRRGVKVKQGQLIGYVGSTGLSTGPHLDYRIKKHNRFVDPLNLRLPRGGTVPKGAMADFIVIRDRMNVQLASIVPSGLKLAKQTKDD